MLKNFTCCTLTFWYDEKYKENVEPPSKRRKISFSLCNNHFNLSGDKEELKEATCIKTYCGKNTTLNSKWGQQNFDELLLVEERRELLEVLLTDDLLTCVIHDLCDTLILYVKQSKKADGSEYTPKTPSPVGRLTTIDLSEQRLCLSH